MYDARPERGLKRTCLHCEARFYDLMRLPILCPKCGTEYVEVVRPPPTPRQGRRSAAFGKERPRPVEEAEERENPPPHAAESEEGWDDEAEHEEHEEREADDEAADEGKGE